MLKITQFYNSFDKIIFIHSWFFFLYHFILNANVIKWISELNTTAASTSDDGSESSAEALNSVDDARITPKAELDTDEDGEDGEEGDGSEDVLYMRGASFTIHLDTPHSNVTANETRITDEEDEVNEIPDDMDEDDDELDDLDYPKPSSVPQVFFF